MNEERSSPQHSSGDFMHVNDPHVLLDTWIGEAARSEINDPNAMALATVDSAGMPNVRIVLLKGHDERGFVFYTNCESAKGLELRDQPRAALCLHWKSLRRQVRARGRVSPVSDEEADVYFASRPHGSRIGAWASRQSRPLDSRETLEQAVEAIEKRFGEGAVPRPPFWSGFRLAPQSMEFWQDRPSRLHERVSFTRGEDGAWQAQRLYP